MGSPAQRFAGDRATYPGMQVAEILIWREWLKLYGQLYDSFDYNRYVGPGVAPPPELVEPYRQASIDASKLRIDAVGWRGPEPTLFEVERYAKPRSVGQLLTYRSLWEQDYPETPPPELYLVCSDFNRHIAPALEEYGIQLAVVPVNFSQLAPARLQS
jgi:hypothetical protein